MSVWTHVFTLFWLLWLPYSAWAVEPLLIAHVAPSSGRFALHAEADRRGVEMAVEEFNTHGGVLGREIILISRDPTLDAQQAAQVAKTLIRDNQIGLMIGAIASNVAASMSEVCQQHGVLFINTNSSAPSEAVENAHRTKFVFDANGANFNRVLFRHALAQRTSRRVLLLIEDNEAGHSNATAMRPYISRYGGQVVAEILAPENLTDPLGILKQVAAVSADVVAVVISGGNQIKLFSQIDPEIFERQLWLIGEVDWEELYPAPGTARPLFGTTWAWNLDTPGTSDFVARYRKRYAHTKLNYPGDVTHAAYLATKALLQAIIRAGTTDNHAVIAQLEQYQATAKERMQHHTAKMNPRSHHVQQTIYIARWNPHISAPEQRIEIVAIVPPEEAEYELERQTKLESLAQTPRHRP